MVNHIQSEEHHTKRKRHNKHSNHSREIALDETPSNSPAIHNIILSNSSFTSPTPMSLNLPSETNSPGSITTQSDPLISPSNSSSEHSSLSSTPTSASSTSTSGNSSGSNTRQKIHKNPRAARACATCRKQKTRCFPAHTSKSCFRCLTLGLDCSLFSENSDDNNFPRGLFPDPSRSFSARDEVVDKRQVIL